MADLFNNSKPVDYDTQVNNKPSLYQDKLNEVRNEQAARLENRKRYGVELTDDEYSQINTLIANAENPDEESHKIASAILVSQNTNIPLAEAYQNIDSYIQGLWGNSEKTTSYKNAFIAITDMFAMGANNMKIGVLGNKIIQAEKDGDEEAKQVYMNEYKALMDDNALRQDNAPRTWATKILECGAQSAPYTGAVSGAAVLGSFLGPAGSVAASAITSTALMRGEIYMDMRAKGIEPEIARPASLVSALPQAIVESFLGEAASWAGAGIKALGKGSSKAISSKLAGKLANTMQAKFKFGVGAKLAVKGISEYFGNLAEEGAEEYIQEGIGSVVENVASKKQTKLNQERRAEILEGMATELGEQFTKDFEEELLKEYPDIDVKSFAEIHSNMVESFKGGVMGAIALGAVPTAINTTLTAKEYGIIKDVAEEIPSKEMFKKFAKENPDAKKVFEQFEEGKERDDAISKTWEAAQNTRDKKDAELIAGTKETTAFSEQMEAAPEENEEGETEVIPAYRTKEGRLYTNVEDKTDSDGNEYKTFTVGNAEAEDKNLYGFINYKTDEETNTVTITDFKMAAHRRGLTQEAFEQFAEDHAGENIEWNPTSKRGKELKNYLISQNASGKNNGLNYYKTQDDLVDLESRRNVSKQLRKYMPNLTSDQHAAAISLLEAGARRMGKRLNEYISETFGNQIIKGIGDTHNVEQIFRKFIDTTFNNEKESNNELTFEEFLKDKYNKNSLNEFTEDEIKQIVSQNVKGYSTMPDFQRQVKAVIYAGEHADFSTFAHELAHVWQSQLTGDLKAEAESAFNVKDGDWNNSYYTFADGHTESAAEAFARGFEDYLRNGKAPNEQMKNLFQKFAEFLQDVYRNLKNFINMSPEIENVYNQLMDADDSVMRLAEKAVMDADKEYIQSIKNDIEAKKAAEAQQKKDEKQAKEDAKAEDEEITLNDETVTEPDLNSFEEETEEQKEAEAAPEEKKTIETEKELNKNLDDLMNFFDEMADTEAETETQIKDAALEALENMIFADANDVIETVTNKDPEVTISEKVEKATDAASEVRDDEFFIFQLAGLEGTRNIVDTQERARRIENYYIAKKMSERDNLGYDKETLARKIKQSTGWEKNASGQWVYETDDTQGIINAKVSDILDNGRANALSDTRIPAIRLSALYKNDELYEMYPIAKDFSVQFFTDKIGVNAFIKADGIAINTVGLVDPATLKRRLVHEIQHIIQAVENFAEGDTDVSKTGIHGKDFNELWQSLQQAQLTDGTMFDASNLDVNMGNYMNNAAEIDARNVARRAFMSAKERQNSLLSDTADVKNENILFQLIGEKGATNLDLAEEVTTRRDNLAIAREMEKAGKDAKAIRLATGWEKGKDGLWRYEIADDYHLKNIRATNSKLEKYEKQLKKAKKDYEYLTGLTEEEKEKKRRMIADMVKHNAMPEGTTLESMIEEAETELRKAEMLMEYDTSLDVEQALKRLIERGIDPTDFWADMGESFYLPMLIDNEELFKAYPELEKVTIAFSRKYVVNHMGSYDPKEKSITIYPAGARSYGDFLSVLAHEVQHAIQRIEGFAVGGSQAAFEPKYGTNDIESYGEKLRNDAQQKREQATEILAKINDDINANKKLDDFMPLINSKEKTFDDFAEYIAEEQKKHADYETYKNYLAEAESLEDEANNLGMYKNNKGEWINPTQAYNNLAGEVEARNVQARKRLTPEERLNTLLSETADVAPEDQIVMFEGGVSESRDTEKSLYGIHNLREDALRHVLKMGGIANPSMAVMDINKPGFNNFGEISLIPYNYMLEKGPGNKGTFGADIYSPRYPSVENVVTDLGEKKIKSMLWAVREVNEDLAEELAEKIESRINNAYGGLSKAQIDELGLQIPFLAEKGKTDFYKYNETKFSPEILSKFEEYTKGYLSDEQLTELYKMFEKNEEIIKELTEENGNINHNVLMNFESQLHRAVRTANKVDLWSTIKAAQEIIEGDAELKKQFDEYANEKYNSIERIERIFNGYTPSGNRRYLSHTLENVSKYMKQQGLQGGENFSYGLGSTRAHFTPKFTTLAQIKKAKDRLVTHEEFEEIKDKMNEQYDEICNMLRGGMDYDLGGARFEEAFTTRGVDPISYIKNEYDIDLTDEEANELRSFAEALRVMPTEYFETKFERPVYLNEFAAAVIPANLSQDLKDALTAAGLQIKEYADADSREEITKQALREFDETRRILFQTVDLTQDFAGVDSGSITEQMIENHLNSLIGQTYDTATKPLQIQLTKENNPHVKKSNVKLEKGKKKRHFAALNKIEQIINNASMIGKPTDVDLTHNKKAKTLKHKSKVLKYIYFESPIKINNDYYTVYLDTERVKNQDPALLDLYNIRVKKNVLTGTNLIAFPQGQVNNSGILPNLSTIYLQTVYHGSGANFERFNTDQYGLSGEGSMSFGYGTYLTDDEEIARDYAERQRHSDILTYNGKKLESNDIEKRIYNYIAMKSGKYGTPGPNVNDYELYKHELLDAAKEALAKGNNVEWNKKYLEKLEDPNFNFADYKLEEVKTNLYTVEIPDGGYIQWDKVVRKQTTDKVKRELLKEIFSNPNSAYYSYDKRDLSNELDQVFDYVEGMQLYNNVSAYLEGDQAASKFFRKIGYTGIKYPAGTIHGNGNGAYNYVIFNDEEAKIVDHLLFQTQQELFKDAMNFDSWQEFMEYYENEGGKPEVSLVPEDSDAAWYKATWEMAKGITHESSEDKTSDENMSQRTMDALFMAHISAPGQLEEFLKQLNYINTLDFENLPPAMDAEEQAERDKEMQLKDVIRNKLSHGSWLSNATRIAKGKELTPATRNRLLTLMNLASREYRDVYTQITGNTEFAVPENESFFNENIAANAKKLNKLVSPEEAVTMSPEQLRNLADSLSDEVSNKEIAAKIKNGTLKMDSELTDYIKRLEKRVKAAEDRFNKLEEETKADYGRIKDFAQRRILNTYDELLKARAKLNNKKNLLDKKITSGLKITEKYRKDVQNAQATYDDIFITWNNLTKVTKISAEVQEAMKRKEEYIQTVEEQAKLKNDKAILTQISDMRRKLVKNAMRRVPLNRIEYGHAKKIIAIQRLLYPNLEFGVNKWIGENAVYIKGLAAEYLTNPETKEQIDKAIRYRIARAGTAAKLKKLNRLQELLAAMKTSDDINTWTDAEKNNLLRYIPKNDWIKELNLEALEKERAETIQLDIDEEGYSEVRTITDEKGNEYFKTLYRPKFSEEIGEMVKDAIGVDMFNLLINKPFEDWNTSQMEKLTKRINELYIEGRDELEAKRQLQKDEANEIRERIRNTIRATDIKINDTDTPEERKRKQEEINKLLGTSETTKGTLASKKEKRAGKINAILHGFADANVRRFARILDNLDEGANVEELYYKENLCYEAKQEMLRKRGRKINEVMRENKIELDELYKTIKVGNKEFTVDELLFFLAADKDYEQKESFNLEDLDTDPYADNDDYAPTARNAVMFGNLGSADNLTEWKESLRQLDEDTKERIQNDQLTEDEKQAVLKGMKLITTPGTRSYIQYCHNEYAQVIKAAKAFLAAEENAKFNKLAEAIEADYTEQFERLQRVSIEEFNAEVFRVKAYVPLNRMESNGDTNENRVKEDLLATSGASAGKNYVDKGMTQKRRTMSPLNQKPVEMGLYKTWADATERTEHFINYASYVRELNRVYKSRDAQYLRRFIENRHGKAALEYIDNYIAEVANPNATSATGAIDSFVKLLRGKAAPAYLSWKASSIIKQAATSPAPYMQFITPVEYLKACFDIIASKGTLNDDIKEKSVFMENRTMDPLLDLVKEQLEAKTNKIEHKFNQIGAIGMQGLEWIDWACVAPGWLACYRKKFAELVKANDPSLIEEQIIAENNKLDPSDPARLTKDEIRAEVESRLLSEDDLEKEAVHYADDCTRLCQPSNRSVDLAPLFKNKEKNSEIGKAVLQFQTSLNVIWNNIRYDIPYAVRQKKFKQIAGMIFGYIFAGILVNSITEGYKVNEEDDEEKQQLDRLRKFLYYSTTQFTDAIPVIGGAVTQANSKIIGGNKGFASSSADIFPMFTKVIDGTKAITKGDWEKAAWKYGEAAGLATGLPVSGTKEVLYAAGIGDKDGQLEFNPESFLGRRD